MPGKSELVTRPGQQRSAPLPTNLAASSSPASTNLVRQAQFAPSSLSAGDVLQLQRTIGNKAVSRLLAGRSRPVQPQPATPHIQRDFGFELELPALLTYEGDDNSYYDPYNLGAAPLAQNPEFDLKADHMQNQLTADQLAKLPFPGDRPEIQSLQNFQHGPSIVELATKPWDERALTEDAVGDKMQTVVDYANQILANTNGLTAMAPVPGLADFYFAAPRPDAAPLAQFEANTQISYGVKIDRIPQLFAWQGANRPQHSTSQALQEAAAAANAAATQLSDQFLLPAIELPRLRGLLTLMANYLVAGTKNFAGGGLGKNRLGQLFYKTSLANLRKQYGDIGVGHYITQNDDIIRMVLLHETNRDPYDPIGPWCPQLTCETWIEEVLTGTDDKVFTALLNPTSLELGPDMLGTPGAADLGPVVENRKPGLQFLPDSPPNNYRPDRWVGLAKSVYNQMKQINQVP